MIKKILVILAIISPFLIFYLSNLILKKKTKYPIIKLSLISIILLLGILLYFRFLDDTKPGEKYNPPKLENGKIILERKIEKSNIYNNKSDKFELDQNEKNITNILSEIISDNIISSIINLNDN